MNTEEKLQAILQHINSKTRHNDGNLTAAVSRLCGIISTNRSVSIQPLSVTENGTFSVSGNVDGYNPVTVNVPVSSPALQVKSVTPAANPLSVVADDGFDGLASVNISAIPPQYVVPEGSLCITENGTYDVSAKSSAVVSVQAGTPSLVPNGYTQYEYLESSGTQFIDTGINPTLNTETECECQCLVGYADYACVWGTGGGTNGAYYGLLPQRINGSLTRGGKFSSTYPYIGNSGEQNCYCYPSARITYKLNKDGLYGNGALMCGVLATEVNQPNNIYLFGRNDNNTFARPMYCRIFRYKHRENGALVRDMVPCMRDTDSVLGMYDIVNDVFYTNAGTGTFTGGALE